MPSGPVEDDCNSQQQQNVSPSTINGDSRADLDMTGTDDSDEAHQHRKRDWAEASKMEKRDGDNDVEDEVDDQQNRFARSASPASTGSPTSPRHQTGGVKKRFCSAEAAADVDFSKTSSSAWDFQSAGITAPVEVLFNRETRCVHRLALLGPLRLSFAKEVSALQANMVGALRRTLDEGEEEEEEKPLGAQTRRLESPLMTRQATVSASGGAILTKVATAYSDAMQRLARQIAVQSQAAPGAQGKSGVVDSESNNKRGHHHSNNQNLHNHDRTGRSDGRGDGETPAAGSEREGSRFSSSFRGGKSAASREWERKGSVRDPSTPIKRPAEPRRRCVLEEITAKLRMRPVIIVPTGASFLVNYANAYEFFQNAKFSDPGSRPQNPAGLNSTAVALPPSGKMEVCQEIKGKTVKFKLVEAAKAKRFELNEWRSVVAVVVAGPEWQFRGWPFKTVEDLFRTVKGFYFAFTDSNIPVHIMQWKVSVVRFSRTHRHCDGSVQNEFWRSLESFLLLPREARFATDGSAIA